VAKGQPPAPRPVGEQQGCGGAADAATPVTSGDEELPPTDRTPAGQAAARCRPAILLDRFIVPQSNVGYSTLLPHGPLSETPPRPKPEPTLARKLMRVKHNTIKREVVYSTDYAAVRRGR
jgi:hypothetical protein